MADASTWVVLEVGCLECSEWSEVLYASTDENAAREAFDRVNRERAAGLIDPKYWEAPDKATLAEGPATLVDARGTGGSYFYPVQLHKLGTS